MVTSPRTTLRAAALIVVTTLAAAAPLSAASAEESLDLRYSLSVGALGAADMALRHEEDGEGYRSELSTRARGVAHLLSRYQSAAVSEGRESAGDGLAPESYCWISDQRQRTRTIDVVFDPDSGDVVRMEMQRNGKPKRTEVPPELQVGVVDPLTAIFNLRRRTAEALAGEGPERFGASVFDGRRRYDIEAEILGRGRATIDGEKHPVVEVKLNIRPLAGFDEHDLEQVPGEDGYARVQLSDDGRLVPLDVRTYGAPVATRLELIEDCSDGRRCGPIPTN